MFTPNRTFFTLSKLLAAYLSCRQRKRTTISAIKFEFRLEEHLIKLHKQLRKRTYRPGKSICFVVTYPKTREIFAAAFADRIVHHLLVSEIEPYFERNFIYQSFACRKAKGTHTAVAQLRKALSKATLNYTRPYYYGHFDINSFFTSIDKNLLYEIVEKRISKINRSSRWKDEVLYLTKTIIFHDPTDNYRMKGNPKLFEMLPIQKSLFSSPDKKGLPIGNLTSQFFANVYLNPLDQYAKRKLKINYYFRYVDDIVVLSENKPRITRWERYIEEFIESRLKLHLHPQKTKVDSVYRGIDFLGYFIKPRFMLVRKRVVKVFKSKLHYINQQTQMPSVSTVLPMVNSYYGHFQHANSYNLRRNLYEKHFYRLKRHLRPKNKLFSFRPRKPTA